MIKEVLLSSAIVLFAGCNSKYEDSLSKSLDKSIEFDKHMQKTEKITISDINETKISLTVSYLNSEESILDEKNSINEKFIVGIYMADGIYSENFIDENQNMTIHIDYPKPKKREEFTKAQMLERKKGMDRLPISVKKVAFDDPVLKNMTMVNSWGSYYYVEFPHSISKRFTLTYQNKTYGTREKIVDGNIEIEHIKYHLNFAKNGKYIYSGGKKLF